ncbi:MAG TPA: divergent polysaccharide deacetylase family protein [Gammaproteobacteria bacterium]|nr:divergent polysaccharide deacetylase family protein [Gammaproteobacteria bacterium]
MPTRSALANTHPVVAIIIDDLGNSLALDKQAIALPGPVACSFLPDTPYAARLARVAHHAGKEVLLHLPLEALGHEKLGPGGLTLPMTRREFVTTVRADLAAIPDVDGVNNHMGSLLTQHPGDMAWLMETLKQFAAPLFFVDSRTTPRTVAYRIAREYGVPATSRDVFLDDVQTKAAINRQLQELIAIAKRHGTAVAIGHPYAVTLAVLARQLPRLAGQGVRLVGVRQVIARQESPESKSALNPVDEQNSAADRGGAGAHP